MADHITHPAEHKEGTAPTSSPPPAHHEHSKPPTPEPDPHEMHGDYATAAAHTQAMH